MAVLMPADVTGTGRGLAAKAQRGLPERCWAKTKQKQ